MSEKVLCRTMSCRLPLGKCKYVSLTLTLVAKFFTNLQGFVLHYLSLGWKIDLKGLFINFYGYVFHVYITSFFGYGSISWKSKRKQTFSGRTLFKILLQLVLVQPSLTSSCKLVSNSQFRGSFQATI